ncbi:MAG: hypothetical protein WAV76_06435 [Bacteroidota bacterium]
MPRTMTHQTHVWILLFGVFLYSRAAIQGDSTTSIHFKNGYKEYHYGIPFLYLKGTDYETGLQYGTLLKDEITTMHEDFEKFKKQMMENEIQYLPWYERIIANLFGGMIWKHKINTYAGKLPPNIEDQIRGASEGSGLPESFFREIQVVADLYSNRCEAIVIKKGNHTYHCHNLDQPLPVSMISKYPVVVNYDIKGKQKYTDFGFAACLMITTACNESGISLSENGNNNAFEFDKNNCSLYSEKSKLITETHNLQEVDSIAQTLTFPLGLIYTISSSKEKQAVVYDFLGSTKASTPVHNYQFVANRTISKDLGKKSETIYSGQFHDTCREIKFAELIDTAKPNIVDEAINILGNTDFYHYTDSLPVYLESLHNYETDQSVIFDLADSTIYFTFYAHFAAWNRWLKYNYITHKVSLYRKADPRLSGPFLAKLNELYGNIESCDWRDSVKVRSLVNSVVKSKIENYFCLDFLAWRYRDYYKLPVESMQYADKLIKKYPDVITGYYNKGRALEAEKKYSEAVVEYTRALESTIQCEYYLAETEEHLALVYSFLGQKEAAAVYAAKALEIQSQYWMPEYLKERLLKLETIKKSGN